MFSRSVILQASSFERLSILFYTPAGTTSGPLLWFQGVSNVVRRQ
jgi:hypothetical protein